MSSVSGSFFLIDRLRNLWYNQYVSGNSTHSPISYRGYYYDMEYGFYCLGTRFYDPVTRRFINADGYVSTGQGLLGNNMYTYCGNNPVNNVDPSGSFWIELALIVSAMVVFGTAVKFAVQKSNYVNNSLRDWCPNSTKNETIKTQEKPPASDYDYGFFKASYNGCEAIAVHNAKVLKGMESTLSGTINDIQNADGMLLYGVFGTNPYAIGRVLRNDNIAYSRVNYDEMTQSGIYIVSYWTGKPFLSQIHTIAVQYDGVGYDSLNYSGKKFNPYNYENGRFIVGYYLGN